MHKKTKLLETIFFLFFLFNTFLIAKDLEIIKIFTDEKIDGTIVIESLKTKKRFIHNGTRANRLLSPASTFKIPHTLIALNEGIVTKDSVLIWDKEVRNIESWNKDQSLKSAFQNSCVWCYKEFTSKIAVEKYKKHLKDIDYGNKSIGLNLNEFWLDGSLRINAYGQIKFLKKLHENDLPFKAEDLDFVKEIMIEEKNDDYILRAKTGYSKTSESEMGLYIGYLETSDDVWFFVTNILIKGEKDLAKRKEITLEVLKAKGIIKGKEQ